MSIVVVSRGGLNSKMSSIIFWVLILMKWKLYVFFSVVTCALGILSKKPLPNPTSQGYTSIFSSKNFSFSSYTEIYDPL